MLGEPTAHRQNLPKDQRGLPEEVLPRPLFGNDEMLARCTATKEDRRKLNSHRVQAARGRAEFS